MSDDDNTIRIPERAIPAALQRAAGLDQARMIETHRMFLELIAVLHERIITAVGLLDAGRTRQARIILEAQCNALDRVNFELLAPSDIR